MMLAQALAPEDAIANHRQRLHGSVHSYKRKRATVDLHKSPDASLRFCGKPQMRISVKAYKLSLSVKSQNVSKISTKAGLAERPTGWHSRVHGSSLQVSNGDSTRSFQSEKSSSMLLLRQRHRSCHSRI